MELLSALIVLAPYVAFPAVGGVWWLQSRRSRRRNAKGACAICGESWATSESDERYLVHGRLICVRCASRTRVRLFWQFGVLAGAAALSSVTVLLGDDPGLFVLAPPAMVVVFTAASVGLMKLANRRAERRIAEGDFPFLHSESSMREIRRNELPSRSAS